MKFTPQHIMLIKVTVHLTSLGFVASLCYQALTGALGADPVQGISHFTGKAALNTLLITMLISPLARLFRQGALIKIRRPVGLYSFFWALLHLLGYLVLDLGLNWSLLASEIVSRPYLALGLVCWLILLALAVTSTTGMRQRLGARWQKLHNWVYMAVLLAPIHYYWSVKSGVTEPALYILAALVLLSLRYRTLTRWIAPLRFSGR